MIARKESPPAGGRKRQKQKKPPTPGRETGQPARNFTKKADMQKGNGAPQ